MKSICLSSALLLGALVGGCGTFDGDEAQHVGDVLLSRVAPTRALRDAIVRTMPEVPLLPPVEVPPAPACAPTKVFQATVGTDAVDPAFVPAGTGSYSLWKTRRLYVGAMTRGLCGPQLATFEVWRPDGSKHGRFVAGFVPEGAGVGARAIDGGYVVSFTLPLADAGLAPTELVGTWSVRFTVDTDSRSSGSATFVLF